MPCLLLAWGIFILPEAVNLNLFFAELFVFSLGIIIPVYICKNYSLQGDIILC
tara:strand:+ start:369 stop:527 length:159 start_codon:yes stop_codon:yes gene_type:complete